MLGEFRAFAAATSDVTSKERVAIEHAEADFAQDEFPVANAIDGKEPTGWAIAPQVGCDHWAMFFAKKPIDAKATPWLQLVLSQNHGLQHTIGRFRVMVVSGRDPLLGIPPKIRDVLAVAADKRSGEQTKALSDYFLSRDKKFKELADQVATLKARVAAEPVMKVRVIAQRTEKPRASHLLHRGDFLQPEAEVRPGTLAVLPPIKPRTAGTADRLDLAAWLVEADNPLTPRVTVNHLWSNLFGRGIVRTANDFGVRGERPTHPELLDWLATELVGRGWSRKEMIRLIVSSATYRQASASRSDLAETDPLNDLFYRQNRYRVEAEIVRDLALSVGGLLSGKIGGPSVFPPLPAGITDLSYANNFKWNTSTGEDLYRRGMYTFFKRTAPHPNLTTFDCPDSNTTCVEHRTSNTPLQALTTLNNESFVEASQALGCRLLAAGPMTDAERLAVGLRWCIARAPNGEEVAAFAELLAASRKWYAENPSEAPNAVGKTPPPGVPVDEAAAWVATARIMLNLDEFLTRE